MAVYTQLGAETLTAIIAEFDVGALVSAKGIAEGVSNSNWLIDTAGQDGNGARFILTMYEARTDIGDLPFFLGLLDHLAARDCPVPRTIHDRVGQAYRLHEGKALALIEFLPGISVSEPTPAQARAVGAALAQVHIAAADFAGRRANSLGPKDWESLAKACGSEGLASIHPELAKLVERELARLERQWPRDLPHSVIHADLFPDNVLMLGDPQTGDRVTGLIDFYFACYDITAYDLAVTHAAWCFSNDGSQFDAALSEALLAGYEAVRPLLAEERAALPVLARGAAMRFLMTRAYDWMNTPEGALVTRKDPLAFARRLDFYADPANAGLFGPAEE
ncbi:homoserine kinase [Novosphingobium sp. G106]|uniref:homoserine kinase n=1 Tax=Novosphingobium sp. G106 TaxID=2849500 RepID=UPI001C2DCC0D|nr:homoserine kinase [Novosphingobium sp. G106]MBV1686631.1 homoserine kinase [Novosphingobium sp. G106]